MSAVHIKMNRCKMGIKVTVAAATVGAVTALGFKSCLTAGSTQLNACIGAVLAGICVMEAIAAILAEVEFVVAILDTYSGGIVALGVVFTAVHTKLTELTHLDLAKGNSAIGAEMVVPIGVFGTVFAAVTALRDGIVQATELTEAAIVAKLDSVLV